MMERWLQWFSHVMKHGGENLVRATLWLRIASRRNKVRPIMTWNQLLKVVMGVCWIDLALIEGRRAWKTSVHQPAAMPLTVNDLSYNVVNICLKRFIARPYAVVIPEIN